VRSKAKSNIAKRFRRRAPNHRTMAGSPALRPGETFAVERLWTPAAALETYFAAVTLARPVLEHVALEAAAGRILGADATAHARYPADPRSTMDGFAVVAADGDGVRRIVGEVRMGHAPTGPVAPGEAMRIPTGGVLPAGADAVIPVEDTDIVDFPGEVGEAISVREPVAAGDSVTPAGADMEPGDVVLRAGRRIGAPELAVLATLGITAVPVFRRPRVAVISTGDELVDAGATPATGQVRDSNRWALAGALAALGCEPLQRPAAGDTAEALTQALRGALDVADAVVLTGGSSVGVRDLTPRVIDDLGAPGVVVHGLRVKPGKPTVLAMLAGKPVIGLPGNPASSLMILEAIVAPVFSRLAGEAHPPLSTIGAIAGADFTARPGWTWYVPAELRQQHGRIVALPLVLRSAHTSLLARAHGYVVVGPEPSTIAAGAPVIVRRFSGGGTPVSPEVYE
jgi:molybdopterin molybdotransferase